MTYRTVATCGFGLESILSFELRRLGVENIQVQDGRILFDATPLQVAQANVCLRTAERVLIIAATYPARTFDELFDGAKAVPWGEFIGRKDAFPVKGYTMNSALTSVPACQSVLKKALVERLKRDYGTVFLPENSRTTVRVRFSIIKDVCTVMIDTSGDGLHKRGYRPLLNEAPIKETIAAGICDLARVFPESRVCDPFCGSGTLVIEAAMRAKNIAPGLNRRFAAEQYGFIGERIFAEAKEAARAAIRTDAEFFGRGMDIDPAAAELAAQNAKRAGVGDITRFSTADACKLRPAENEIILANPPYGERLSNDADVQALYTAFGRNLKDQKYKGLYVITSYPEFESSFGKKADKRRKLYNGMLTCQLYMYF